MRAALVVGIDHYPSSPLNGCVADARGLAQLLGEHFDGAPNFAVNPMLSADGPVTRPKLREQMQRLFDSDFEVALFYFAGHGTITDVGGCVVTQDVTRYDEGVSMTDILTLANRSKAREVVIVLDCCHSGAFGMLPPLDSTRSHLRQGLSVLCASRDSESAAEINGRGVFSGLLVEALHGGASDLLGRTTVADLFAFVDVHLGPWNQRPLFKCNVSTLTSLRQTNPRIAVSELRELASIFPTPEAAVRLDSDYESCLPGHRHVGERAALFNKLRTFRAAGLVTPSRAQDMYVASLMSDECCLTKLGKYYWHLVSAQRI
jgi:hypothetical protein